MQLGMCVCVCVWEDERRAGKPFYSRPRFPGLLSKQSMFLPFTSPYQINRPNKFFSQDPNNYFHTKSIPYAFTHSKTTFHYFIASPH